MPVISSPPPGDATADQPTIAIDEPPTFDAPTMTIDPEPSPSGRRWRRWAIGGGALIAIGGIAAAVLLRPSESSDTAEEQTQIRAVEAEQRDLVEFTDIDGTLQYALTGTVTSAVAGSVTSIVADGDTLERGDTAYEIDATPVVVFYGDVPFYRPLTEGTEGDDVEILEANLASLGYHVEDDGEEVDTGFVVDGIFDAATTDAVLRWQEDVGLESSGEIVLGRVVVTPGPSVASGLQVELGSVVQVGSAILDLNVTSVIEGLYSRHTGELVIEAGPGEVTSGQILYSVDDVPIVAIVADVDFERDLTIGVDDGDDVLALEEMLVALGYDARGDLDVDERFDEFTTEAIEDWEEDLQDDWDAVVVDGVLSLDEIILVDSGTTIGSVTERDSEITATGSELFSYSSTDGNRIVATAIDVAEQDKLTEGASVDVEFPDGSIVTGVVSEVATSSIKDPTDDNAEAQLPVEITLGTVPDSVAGLNELDVEVKVVEDLVQGATVIPAAALASTADGGFAVEVVNGGSTSFVAVEPGMFADGFVEVSGIDPGTAVVVPS